MIHMSQHDQRHADQHVHQSHHRPKRVRITSVKYVPVTPDALHRQFVALFDLLGLDGELFDNASPNHTMKAQQ
jgi:hypothetical protein